MSNKAFQAIEKRAYYTLKRAIYCLSTLICFQQCTQATPEQLLKGAQACQQIYNTPSLITALKEIIQEQQAQQPLHFTADRPLLVAYPTLKNNLSWLELGQLQTPIRRLNNLEAFLHSSSKIYLKDDSKTAPIVGGNKVRALELLLADAFTQGASHILAFGSVGSNSAATTAFYSNKLGLHCSLLLKPQPNSPTVRNNLLVDLLSGAKILYYPTEEFRQVGATAELVQITQNEEQLPYVIPTGGASPLGTIGYVNAAFELKSQIDQGLLPEPNYLYVPLGSMATAAGLLIGLRACNIKTQIVAVAIEPEEYEAAFTKLVTDTNNLLHSLDPDFPLFSFTAEAITLHKGFMGPGYGFLLPEVQEAIERFSTLEGIRLEGTYSGKAAAALIHDTNRTGSSFYAKDNSSIILFWNSFGIEQVTAEEDCYQDLPKPLHHYFKE